MKPHEDHETLQHLRNNLFRAQELFDSASRPFKPEDLRLIQSVKEQLGSLAKQPSHVITWSYGTMLVTALTKTMITNALQQQKISVAFLESLNTTTDSVRRTECKNMLNLMSKTLHFHFFSGTLPSKGPDCLYLIFLKKCFDYIREGKQPDHYKEMILESGPPTLLYLCGQDGRRNVPILHQILNEMFMELVTPSNADVKVAAKQVLKSCGWKITDSIREMLNCTLLSGDMNDESAPYISCQHVYGILLELIKIDKDLVVGLINNTELCLGNGREDRLIGLKFFCQLFGSTSIEGLPNPSDFFSHLWQEFLQQDTCLYEQEELLLIASHTGELLKQPRAHQDWCHLLFDLFEYVLVPECEKKFIIGITEALKHNRSLAAEEKPKSLISLVGELLTPASIYERFGVSRDLLLMKLGEIYRKEAEAGTRNMTLKMAHGVCSKLLTCFFGTCASPFGTSTKWTQLQKLYVESLVPYSANNESRMKSLLYLWIQAGENGWVYLHELFSRTKRARHSLQFLLSRCTDREFAKQHRLHTPGYLMKLQLLLKNTGKRHEFFKQFFEMLSSSSELRQLLKELLSQKTSCADNRKAYENICSLWKEYVGIENEDTQELMEELFLYLTELTCDKESIKFLIDLVDSCINGEVISTALGLNRLHVARASLKLLNEVLFLQPHLGFYVDNLKLIIEWSRMSLESVSMLALRCLMTMSSSCYKLADCVPKLTVNVLLPIWFEMIHSGSRGQTKMAIGCLSEHTTLTREKVLHDVFNIISSYFEDLSNMDNLERGVSALGHFSVFCPASLKLKVERLCVTIVLQYISGHLDQVQFETSFLDTSTNTWVDWRELPFHVLIKVQALRTIGRCMRYCGTTSSVSEALQVLQEVASMSKDDASSKYREVDVAYLRFEASSAILFILEEVKFQSLISKQLVLVLSHALRDPRMEVRSSFARKLCHGLSPHKVWSHIDRRRGHLPPCLLGLLPLLGSNLWMNDRMLKKEAEDLFQEVCVSRYVFQHENHVLTKLSAQNNIFYEEEPLLVLENIFAIAVPVLAENICDFSGKYVSPESLEEIANCFKFTCSMLCHVRTYGGQVHKDYLINMVNVAKERVSLPDDLRQRQKYGIVFQVMENALKHYRLRAKEPLFPSVDLPLPLFNIHESIDEQLFGESILSETDLKRLDRKIYKKVQQEGSKDDSEGNGYEIDDSLCSLDDSSVNTFISEFTVQEEHQNVQRNRTGSFNITGRWSRETAPQYCSTPVSTSTSASGRKRRRAN